MDLFNHFDSYFEKHIKPRKDLRLEDDFLDSDPPFPKEAVLQILRVMRIVLENCTNKHFLSCYEVIVTPWGYFILVSTVHSLFTNLPHLQCVNHVYCLSVDVAASIIFAGFC